MEEENKEFTKQLQEVWQNDRVTRFRTLLDQVKSLLEERDPILDYTTAQIDLLSTVAQMYQYTLRRSEKQLLIGLID